MEAWGGGVGVPLTSCVPLSGVCERAAEAEAGGQEHEAGTRPFVGIIGRECVEITGSLHRIRFGTFL